MVSQSIRPEIWNLGHLPTQNQTYGGPVYLVLVTGSWTYLHPFMLSSMPWDLGLEACKLHFPDDFLAAFQFSPIDGRPWQETRGQRKREAIPLPPPFIC